ncbi:tape measure protein [Acinetobacter pittii]|uniref:tape measure protein n=1 Tax=Acinetobacter pittii TaxID=48296 RepID=UPI00192C277E|nr:tape measure protein [Acinetobacter pittii]
MAQESRLVIVIDAKNAERNARNLGNELDSIERKGDFATKSMDSLSVATRQLAGYMAGLVTVSAAISKMDTYTGLQNRLKLVTNNQIELNKATEDTFRIAQKTYSAWDSVLQVYQRFSDNAKTLNLTMDDTARLTETVSKAVAISGASASAADAALVQFGQALASGTLRGEELNSVMEQTPALAKAIAQGMGITVGELRSVAAEGKITSQELVRALKNVQSNVDELFAKTDITIGQSLTLLNNEITKFVGEAGKGTGAAQVLAESIRTLGNNLDLIIDGAIVAGIGLLTKAIVTKTIAVQASIIASAQQRAASIAEAQAQAQLLGVEAARTRQAAALALTEIGLARAEYNAATTSKQRASAIQRKTSAEIAHSVAIKEATAATLAYKAAQDSLNKATTIGSRALDLVGGPIGAITLGITALAAGYMYFQERAAKANKRLEEQAAVAKKAKEELLALKGIEKDSAINDMTSSFERQNQALSDSSTKINIQLNAIAQLYKGNKDIVQVVNDARDGTISMNDAVKRFNELRISKDIYNAIKENTAEFEKNAKEAKTTRDSLKLFGIEVELSGRKAQTAVAGIDDNSKALIGNESAAQKATKAQKGYFDSLRTEVLKSNEDLALLNLGYSEETIKKINELQKAKQAVAPPGTTAIVTKEEMDVVAQAVKTLDLLKDKKDALNDAERKQTKELAKQAVLLAGNSEQTRNMLRVYQAFRNAGVGDKQARVLTAQVGRENDFRSESMFGSHKDANNGYTNTGFISWQKGRSTKLMQALQGQGVLDKKGQIQQTQDALDAQAKFLLQEVVTNKNYSKSKSALLNDDLDYRSLEKIIGKNFIGWDYEGKKLGKDKASKHLAKQDSYFNQLNKILGSSPDAASKAIGDLSRFEDEAYKARAKTLEEIKQLQATYDTEAIERGKKREEEISKATILGQTDLIPKIKQRFDAEDELAKKQFDFETNGFKWTEEKKLEYTKETNSLRLIAEGKLSDEQIKIAKQGLDEQYQHELELIKLTKQAQQAAYDQSNLKALQELKQQRDLLAAPLGQRAGLSLQFDERNALSENDTTLINKGREAQMKLKQKEIDELQYNMRIEDAVRLHEETKHKIREEYAEKYRDLQNTQYQAELGMYNNLLSQASNVWGGFTQLIKDSAGEQSAAYKTMFLMQQAMSIASALVSTHLAAAQVMADPSALTLAQKTSYAAMITGLGYANVGLIAAQTIAGFSSGGYTGDMGRGDVAGVVHGQEYVLNAAATKRVGVGTLNAINSGGSLERTVSSSEQPVTIQVYVTDSGVNTNGANTQDQKQLGQMIGNAVRTIIRQEQRQGGLLSK